jgi:restriction endonuclease
VIFLNTKGVSRNQSFTLSYSGIKTSSLFFNDKIDSYESYNKITLKKVQSDRNLVNFVSNFVSISINMEAS